MPQTGAIPIKHSFGCAAPGHTVDAWDNTYPSNTAECRTVKPKGKRLGSAALLGAVIVPVLYFSAVQGHGWLAIGYLLVGMASASLVAGGEPEIG